MPMDKGTPIHRHVLACEVLLVIATKHAAKRTTKVA